MTRSGRPRISCCVCNLHLNWGVRSNTGHTFESKLHIDYSTKNHPPQLHAADDLDGCFMAILS